MIYVLFLIINFIDASPKPCKPGCTKRGNCNRETGSCECSFGWIGEKCETNLLSHCTTGARNDGSYVVNLVGNARLGHKKSCACWLQLRLLDMKFNVSTHAMERWRNNGVDVCYERVGNVTQFSDPPFPSQAGIVWKRGLHSSWKQEDPFMPTEAPPPGHSLPQDMCPHRCNERGTCSPGRSCMCGGFKGRSCELEDDDSWHCLRSSTYQGKPCSGRGRCRAGFCHCDEGFWGLDCSRSQTYQLTNSSALPTHFFTRLRIYRYELPWQSSVFHYPSTDDSMPPRMVGSIYWPFEEFMGLLSGNTARTENIFEANLFYIPDMLLRHPIGGGNIYDPSPHLLRTIAWIKRDYSQQWARYGGRDHFFWLPGDLGACWLKVHEDLDMPIKVVHWGLEIKAKDHIEIPGSDLARINSKDKNQCKCFKSERDVVVPNWIKSIGFGQVARSMWEEQARVARSSHSFTDRKRNYLLFFSGGIYGWSGKSVISKEDGSKEYSGGVRQVFYDHVVMRNHTDVLYVAEGGGPDLYHKATFCLSPYGAGWGSRLPQIMISQCIPLIIQDHVYQPFHDLLPYESFSVVIRKTDIPDLVEILRAISWDEVQKMRAAMGKVYKSFLWSPELGGEAFNRTLESLWKRRVALSASHYM